MTELITPKQREYLQDEWARINLLTGSVRSGKTWISLVSWAIFLASMPKNAKYLMVGQTLTTLRENCLDLLCELEPSFEYSLSAKVARLYDRIIRLEGANDTRAMGKIRGSTLAGAYIDELTLIPENFYTMVLSRLSIPGAKLFATTNPDSPEHYVYKRIIENNKIRRKVYQFQLTDNTILAAENPEYFENISNEYAGVFYDRYVLGKWVKAEGLIYSMYNNTVPTVDRNYSRYIVSMDYGTQNPFAALLLGECGDKWYGIKEYYYCGRETQVQKTDDEYYADIDQFCGDLPIERFIIDPSAASFIAKIRRAGKYTVNKADNDVSNGIRDVAVMLQRKELLINDCCVNTIREFGLYSWNPDTVEDTPIKESDHCLTGDTLVNTVNGEMPIKDLIGKEGYLWSYNIKSGKAEIKPFSDCRLTQKHAHIYRIKTTDGKVIRCTADHLILTPFGYIPVRRLNITNNILDIANNVSYAKIESIIYDGMEDVYNLEVEDTHNFAVNGGLIVHNCMDALRYHVRTLRLARQNDQPHYESVFRY